MTLKRSVDVILAVVLLVLAAPLLGLIALGIALTSRGGVMYKACRVGVRGDQFVLHKFRTMRPLEPGAGSRITVAGDSRVFLFGRLLRATKLDELPQLIDILSGKMSIVGPRPEDPKIVEMHYTPMQMETLNVRPGLLSPGSIYNYTHGESLLVGPGSEQIYAETLLPLKLALDLVYVRRASFFYDVRLMGRAASTILQYAVGKRSFPPPPEMPEALRLLADGDPKP